MAPYILLTNLPGFHGDQYVLSKDTPVLINNAGILVFKPSDDALREAYDKRLNTNLTSVAVIITVFMPLLHKATSPKVIDVTSGLGSIANTVTKKMGRFPSYGSSKIDMNCVTVHMRAAENDRTAAEDEKGVGKKEGRVRFYMMHNAVNSALTI